MNSNTVAPDPNTGQSTIHLNQDQLSIILQCFHQQQDTIQSMIDTTFNMAVHTFSPTPPTPKNYIQSLATVALPEYYNNMKYEDIVCKPIRPLCDGSLEHLVLFLNWLDMRRQDEGPYPITFITINGNIYGLIPYFAKLDESIMMHEATLQWTSSTIDKDKHMVDHLTYNVRVLAHLLICSIIDNFSLTITNIVPQHLHNDGPLLLWTIHNNIHHKNVAFFKTIKSKI